MDFVPDYSGGPVPEFHRGSLLSLHKAPETKYFIHNNDKKSQEELLKDRRVMYTHILALWLSITDFTNSGDIVKLKQKH